MAMTTGSNAGQSYSEINMTPLIDFDGTLLWNKTAVDRATMQHYISAQAKKSPQPEVHITVDRFANYEIVAQTLADLQRRGLQKIGFVNDAFY